MSSVSRLPMRSVIRAPGLAHIGIPPSGRRAAVAALSMYSACQRVPLLAQRAAALAVMAAGPRIIPGRRVPEPQPMSTADWGALRRDVGDAVGDWDDEVLYRRPQPGRHGFALLLLRRDRGLAFVRVSPDPHRTVHEHDVMAAVHSAGPETFRVARPLAHGRAHGWGWLAVESGPNYPLGALRAAGVRLRVLQEISQILTESLPRPDGTPPHWTGSHGDLSPWNLRTERGGRVRVIDWEDAGFAPPGADLLYAGLTAQITFGAPIVHRADPEAIDWMRALVEARRDPDEPPDSENTRLLAELSRLHAAAG